MGSDFYSKHGGIIPQISFHHSVLWHFELRKDFKVYIVYKFYTLCWCCPSTGKPRGRQPKVPKHNVDSGGVINISDDSSSDSDGMETDSNSSPDSLLDNDDVIFVNHTNGHTGSPPVFI